jgi:hypothetical protein
MEQQNNNPCRGCSYFGHVDLFNIFVGIIKTYSVFTLFPENDFEIYTLFPFIRDWIPATIGSEACSEGYIRHNHALYAIPPSGEKMGFQDISWTFYGQTSERFAGKCNPGAIGKYSYDFRTSMESFT